MPIFQVMFINSLHGVECGIIAKDIYTAEILDRRANDLLHAIGRADVSKNETEVGTIPAE